MSILVPYLFIRTRVLSLFAFSHIIFLFSFFLLLALTVWHFYDVISSFSYFYPFCFLSGFFSSTSFRAITLLFSPGATSPIGSVILFYLIPVRFLGHSLKYGGGFNMLWELCFDFSNPSSYYFLLFAPVFSGRFIYKLTRASHQ